jgi:hypothetical protein
MHLWVGDSPANKLDSSSKKKTSMLQNLRHKNGLQVGLPPLPHEQLRRDPILLTTT